MCYNYPVIACSMIGTLNLGDDFLKEQLSLAEIIGMFLRRWWVLAISAIVLSVSAFFYAQFMVNPLYTTNGTLYVSAQRTQTSDVSQMNLLASQQLATTYKEILTQRNFLTRVSQDTQNRYSVSKLRSMISINSLNETEIMEIRVLGEKPEDVALICNSILDHAPAELIRVVNSGAVKVLDRGQVPTQPVSPNVKNYTIIAFIIGAAIGCLIVFCIEFLDTRVKSRDDLISRYDEPLLGEIPELDLTANKNNEEYSYTYREKGGRRN